MVPNRAQVSENDPDDLRSCEDKDMRTNTASTNAQYSRHRGERCRQNNCVQMAEYTSGTTALAKAVLLPTTVIKTVPQPQLMSEPAMMASSLAHTDTKEAGSAAAVVYASPSQHSTAKRRNADYCASQLQLSPFCFLTEHMWRVMSVMLLSLTLIGALLLTNRVTTALLLAS